MQNNNSVFSSLFNTGGMLQSYHQPCLSIYSWSWVMLPCADTYLKCCKHEHLLFSTIDLFIKKLPFGLLINLIDSHTIIFWVQIIEWIELEAQAKCVIFPYTLLHYWEWRVKPPVELESISNINLFTNCHVVLWSSVKHRMHLIKLFLF